MSLRIALSEDNCIMREGLRSRSVAGESSGAASGLLEDDLRQGAR
ncbi:MAG TPA: hypothetical protein VG518_02850 [Solirubrobacterales bacterium]|nr:hypothetical protein [Solirubrobacterales bacterium]